MIRRLTGTVVHKTLETLVLEVRDVGYLVHSPQAPHVQVGETITLHTYLAVKENALDLYGFGLSDELELFEQLLTLPKIGPKSALQVLNQAGLELIKTATHNNDPAHLSKLSGLGKKTAEKVVAGLIDIYEKQGLLVEAGDTAPAGGSQHLRDTIDALVALGYPEHDARKTVQQVTERDPALTETNDILKQALKTLGQN